MIADLKTALARTSPSILGDLVGATALVAMLVVGLNLSVLFS
ncbi:MAG: hypothetical protein AAF748_14670 [Pseudomonadota bacterium]